MTFLDEMQVPLASRAIGGPRMERFSHVDAGCEGLEAFFMAGDQLRLLVAQMPQHQHPGCCIHHMVDACWW